jgi:hypothetical protein
MKIAIQGLGEIPTTVLLVLEQEKPDVSHVICSDYQLSYVASSAGFDKPNEVVIKEAASKLGAKVVFHICDVFDPSAVGDVLGDILSKLDPKKDNLVINYTGGTAVVRLLLGTMGVVISSVMKAKVIYAVKYPKGIELAKDHTTVLRDIFERLKITA